MKKAVIGAVMLGIASLGYSQSTNSKIEEVKLSGVEVAPRNLSYMEKVSEGTISSKVLTLEKKASRYNIKRAPFFDYDSKEFVVRFAQSNGEITATYDQNGTILKSSERFRDIALPPAIRNSVYKEYPGWTLHSVLYSVAYNQGTDIKKMYKAQLRKGDAKVSMKLGAAGQRMD